jgi:serralysin
MLRRSSFLTSVGIVILGSVLASAFSGPPPSINQSRPKDAPKVRVPDTCSVAPNGRLAGEPPPTLAAAYNPWRNVDILTVAFLDGKDAWNQSVRRKVQEIVKTWEDYANIRFRFDDAAARPHITIKLEPDGNFSYDLYQSYLGETSAIKSPSMYLIFRPQTDDIEIRRVVLHEFGHALGLIHEQKRPDAGIMWNEEAVYRAYAYTGWTRDQIKNQVMDPFIQPLVDVSPFDPESIMIYPIEKGLANIVVGWTRDLSPMDKNFIGRIYPFPVPPLRQQVLAVGAAPMAGNIAQPGQVARYRFRVPRKATYEVVTTGETPLSVGLYGTMRIDPPGKVVAAGGLNASFEAILDPDNPAIGTDPPGTYFLEVRHQTPRMGTGPFTIAIRTKS